MIIELLRLAGGKTWQYIGIAIAALAMIFAIRRSGKQAEITKNAEINLSAVEKRNDIENNINRLPDDIVHKQLHDKWTRD